MTDATDMQVIETLASSSDVEWEAFFGGTLPALFAMMARRHMHEYGTTKAQLASVAVKNHKHGMKNPNAQFRNEIKLEAALKAPMIADPLGMYDCSPLSDGAAAVILCPLDKAKKYTDKPVKVIGSGQASDMLALHDRKSLTSISSTVAAAKRAFEQAKKKPSDIDVAELHDSYSMRRLYQ
jgi:acetyl-CoA C-acetyltransferase